MSLECSMNPDDSDRYRLHAYAVSTRQHAAVNRGAALLLLANFLLLILPFRFRLQLKGRRREYSLLRPPLSLLIDERKH